MSDHGFILDKEKTTEQMFKVCQYYDVKNVDLAELMCTSEVEVSNWKTGKRFPDWDKIMFFAYIFNISLNDLIVKKNTTKDETLEQIQNKVKEIDKINLKKTLERKTCNNENLSPENYINVRWNPLLQDWISKEKYQESVEKILEEKNNQNQSETEGF